MVPQITFSSAYFLIDLSLRRAALNNEHGYNSYFNILVYLIISSL